jgi:hypothetical protein
MARQPEDRATGQVKSCVDTNNLNESTLDSFWKKLDDTARRTLWGTQLGLASMPLVQNYFGSGAAK